MRMSLLWLVPLSLVFCLGGCASRETPEESGMEVSVDFREVHRCSRISPEITVAYAPRGTKFYDVRLMQGGEQERYLGGGTWQDDGSGVIPEGALTNHYMGPCPQNDRETEYLYVVTALEHPGAQPLMTRFYRFKAE